MEESKTIEESKASVKYIRVSPRKTRLVARLVRGLKAQDAISLLQFTPNKPAIIIKKVIESAVANATDKKVKNAEEMVVSDVIVDGATMLKRFMPRAMGRASRIRKRTSHITVILKSM